MSRDNRRVVLILVGLIGSGKSTFAEALENFLQGFTGVTKTIWVRGKKSRPPQKQHCVRVIDRTSFDASQRAHFIKIAQSFPDTQVWGFVFDTPYQTCANRLKTRTGHPTITSPELGLQVLQRFASDYRPQAILEEGFNGIYHMSPHPTGEYTKEDIASVFNSIFISVSCQEDLNHKRDLLRFVRTNGSQSEGDLKNSIINTHPTSPFN